MSLSILERENSTLTGSYVEILSAGENTTLKNLVVRNTYTVSRVQIRFDENDADSFTINPGESFAIGGFNKLRGKKIEARTVANVAESIRINLFG